VPGRAAPVDPQSRMALLPHDLRRMMQLFARGTGGVPRVLREADSDLAPVLDSRMRYAGGDMVMSRDGVFYVVTRSREVVEFKVLTDTGRVLFNVPDEMVDGGFRGDRHDVQVVNGGLMVCTDLNGSSDLVIELFDMGGRRLAITVARAADGLEIADGDNPRVTDSLLSIDRTGRIFVVDRFVARGRFALPPSGVYLHRLRVGTLRPGDEYNQLHAKTARLPIEEIVRRCMERVAGKDRDTNVRAEPLMISRDYLVLVIRMERSWNKRETAICWISRRDPTVLHGMTFVPGGASDTSMAVDDAGVVVFFDAMRPPARAHAVCTIAPGEEIQTFGLPTQSAPRHLFVGGNGLVIGVDDRSRCLEFISADMPDDHSNLQQPAAPSVALTTTVPAAAPEPYEFRPARTFVQWRPEDSGTWGYPSRAARPDN